MQIHDVPVRDLKAASYNPRQWTADQMERLKESLKRFTAVEPAIVNQHKGRENTIVGGHMRVQAASELAWKTFPCVFVDLPEDRERELNIRLNKNTGEFDMDKLANEFEVEDLKAWGFNESELLGIGEPGVDDEEFNLAKEAGAIKTPDSKEGEIYELGPHRLLCGDSTKPEDVARLTKGLTVNLVFADPPYGVGFKYNSHEDARDEDTYKAFCEAWVANMKAVSELVVITVGDSHKAMWYQIDHKLYEMVWIKMNGMSNGYVSKLLKSEPILVMGKPREKWVLNIFEHNTSRDFPDHPCPKPISLVAELIKTPTAPGDYVLDPFGGSGSTMMACDQLGRRALLIEKDPVYCDVIRKRYADSHRTDK